MEALGGVFDEEPALRSGGRLSRFTRLGRCLLERHPRGAGQPQGLGPDAQLLEPARDGLRWGSQVATAVAIVGGSVVAGKLIVESLPVFLANDTMDLVLF